MLSWIKTNLVSILISAVATLVVSASFLFVMWRGAENAGKEAREFMRVQGAIIEAHNRISENETRVDRVVVDVVQRAMEAPNANVLVPPDVADAWLDGIDSLRNGETTVDHRDEDLSGPASDHAGKGRTSNRRNSSDFTAAGSSISKV